MSLRPSRIHHIRKRGTWRKQFGLENDVCPSELPRLPVCLDEDDEADGRCCDQPGEPEEPAFAVEAACSARPEVAAGGREVPVKLRHLKVAAECGTWRQCIFWPWNATTGSPDRLADDGRRARPRARHARPGPGVGRLARASPLAASAARHGWAEAMAELGDVECSWTITLPFSPRTCSKARGSAAGRAPSPGALRGVPSGNFRGEYGM